MRFGLALSDRSRFAILRSIEPEKTHGTPSSHDFDSSLDSSVFGERCSHEILRFRENVSLDR